MVRPLSQRALAPPVLAAAAALAVAGCGRDEEPARARAGVVEMRLTDYRMDPQAVQGRRGRLEFRVRNDGRVPHNLQIRGPAGVVRLQISTMLPGESSTAEVRLGRGPWTMFCAIGNHEELGLHGALELR